MTCDNRHYTAGTIAELHAIAQMAELRRSIYRLRAKRTELPLTDYGSGFIDALDVVLLALDVSPVQCDNPPAGEL